MLAENLKNVEERVQKACDRAGRDRSSVTLIAVSKTYPVEDIREIMACGVKDFGENKAQEMKEKCEAIETPLNWHFIGNLQTNKVKYVVGRACLIHSVSSLHLAEAIEKEAAKKNLIVPVLAEVNIADEATKQGMDQEEAKELVRAMAQMEHLKVCGLMAIAPPVENPEENRVYFRQMRLLRDEIQSWDLPGVSMTELSMGMTGDFEIAIEEGATYVRVGTAIFGQRQYNVNGTL